MRRATVLLLLLSVTSTEGLFAQCPDGAAPPCRGAQTDPGRKPGVAPNSLAVLYFDNLSADTADAYLAEGLTEELIARLGQLPRLAVKSRAAVQRFRQSGADPWPPRVRSGWRDWSPGAYGAGGTTCG